MTQGKHIDAVATPSETGKVDPSRLERALSSSPLIPQGIIQLVETWRFVADTFLAEASHDRARSSYGLAAPKEQHARRLRMCADELVAVLILGDEAHGTGGQDEQETHTRGDRDQPRRIQPAGSTAIGNEVPVSDGAERS